MKTMNNPSVLYLRYSSSSQREVSLEQQEKVCTEYAKRNGYNVIRVYKDAAMTGKNDHRPQFQQMINDSIKRDFQYVLVYSTDRFSRKTFDAVVNKKLLKDNGVTVISVTENINTEEPSGIIMESIFQGMAEFYSAELSQKIKRGQAYNAENFLALGSIPYGYNRSPEGKYVINEPEAAIVRKIFSDVKDGRMFVEIINELNEKGIKTNTCGAWNRSSFNTMLTNKRYIGTYIWKGKETEDVIPAILDKKLFWDVQEKLKSKRKASGTIRRANNFGVYLLSGKLHCGLCGELMTGTSGTRRDGEKEFYYTCNGRKHNSGCKKSNIRRDHIEKVIADGIKDIVLTDENIRWFAEEAYQQSIKDATDDDINNLEEQLKQNESAMNNLIKAVEKGMFHESMIQRINELRDENNILVLKIESCNEKRNNIPSVEQTVTSLTKFRDGILSSEKVTQGLLDNFVLKAILYEDYVTVFLKLKEEDRQKDIPLDGMIGGNNAVLPRSSCGVMRSLNEPESYYFMLSVA